MRKQSLYLKFNQLLKGSLYRAMQVPNTSPEHDTDAPSSERRPNVKVLEIHVLGAPVVPVRGSLVCVFCPGGHWPIVDMLQYRHNDPDLAVGVTQKENALLKSRCEELYMMNLEIGKITDEYEGMEYQVMVAQKEKEFSKEKSRRF